MTTANQAQRAVRRTRLLRGLNLFGLDHLDPVILAALADERPLLLLGAHGTAKSELLNRLAAALGLAHRHYNASLISFDDLLGYPVPNAARDGLDYLRTPGDLWEAESVFLDEISRCRPETQNKLFSIIHERRVQGLPLERLRYRWAAMNPPPAGEDDEPEPDHLYLGSLPLDPALADRFAYVVPVPALEDLGVRDRRRLLERGSSPPEGDGGLPGLVARARAALGRVPAADRAWVVAWVDGLVAPLREAGLAISGRRAVGLCGTALAVHTACAALGQPERLDDAAFLALRCGLSQRALGRAVAQATLAACHRLALQAAGEPADSPWHAIRAEADPVRRVALALAAPAEAVGRIEMSQLVADACAAQPVAERYALAAVLLPVFARTDRLTSAACELLAEPVQRVLTFTASGEHNVAVHRSRAGEWDRVLATVSRLQREGEPLAVELGNLLYTVFAGESERFDPERVVARFRAWQALFGTPAAPKEAA